MKSSDSVLKRALRLPLLLSLTVALAACANAPKQMNFAPANAPVAASAKAGQLDTQRRALAVALAKEMRSHGKRVWCVPFARNASGIDLRGNARTWWSQAAGVYDRGHTPKVGAVMAFSASRVMPMGHVAVVSQVVSSREIRIDHANWKRNQVSLGMTAIDVSDKNDWSRVRVESVPGQAGRINPVAGFIYKG